MQNKIIIIGNTNNAKLAYYYFTNDTKYKVVAFSVHKEFIKEDTFCGLPVIPFHEIEDKYSTKEVKAFVAIGYTKMNDVRKEMYLKTKEKGYVLENYISSKCNFLSKEKIGDNNFILEDNTIQPFVKIGSNNVIWSGNHIGHDVSIKDHCFITSHVVISGFTEIEENCFIGVNATLRDNIKIKKYSLIGAGATIMKSTEEKGVYLAPKPIKMNKKSTDLKISS